MWQGRVHIGDGWAAYNGLASDQASHAHAAIQVILAGNGEASVEVAGGARVKGGDLVIPPMLKHRLFPSKHPMTLLYLDARLSMARSIIKHIPQDVVAALPDHWKLRFGTTFETAIAAMRAQTEVECLGVHRLDHRLEAALECISRDPRPGAIERAALVVGLSSPRLRTLARMQLRLPLSKWLLWRKLERAGRAIMLGESLAQAALAGGFADQAHMARTMRRMFGVRPSEAALPLRNRSVQEAEASAP